MATKSEKQLTKSLLELTRVVKVMATKFARFYPSSETMDLAVWATRELDELRAELEAE